MKVTFKMVAIIIGILFLAAVPYLTFIYFFTKEAKPIEAYTFSMSYEELEKRISREIKKEPKTYKKGDIIFETRYITLGKDSAKYFFITNLDKDEPSEYERAWIELQAVVDSNFKMIDVFYKNKDEYPDVIKVFEKDFIDKLK